MSQDRAAQKNRFDLVTAGHHFLLKVVPFRKPESYDALAEFLTYTSHCGLPAADVDAVLVRCLSVLNKHTGRIIPNLVDLYACDHDGIASCMAAFSKCVEGVLRYASIDDGRVQQAMAIINERHGDPQLTPRTVATAVGVRPQTLCSVFKQQTGQPLTEYLRDVRLERSLVLLAQTAKSVKEVWTSVGYNHASNYNHDFKNKFGVPPTAYRVQTILPLANPVVRRSESTRPALPQRRQEDRGCTVMIIDDDESSRQILGLSLERQGYRTALCSDGPSALIELERSRPDVIILDFRLGTMTGLECLAKIRASPYGQRPGISIFTADWGVFELERRVRELGAIITSKLCDLEQVHRVVTYLRPSEATATAWPNGAESGSVNGLATLPRRAVSSVPPWSEPVSKEPHQTSAYVTDSVRAASASLGVVERRREPRPGNGAGLIRAALAATPLK